MQNLDEYLYEQTNAGREELNEWRDEKRKERKRKEREMEREMEHEREIDEADNAWSER